MVLCTTLSSFLIILQSYLICTVVTSQPREGRNIFPRSPDNRRGLDLKLLANRAYQKTLHQPLYYAKQNYWLRKRYGNLWRKKPIGSVPLRSYYTPTLAREYNLLRNAESRSLLTPAASFWNNVDEDTKFVEEKIQEYYDQRLNKNKNKWMFKPVQGSTQHLKEIFVGRCWDFVTNRGKYLVNPTKVDCEKLWKAFLNSFSFKGPCDVTFEDYTPFFNMYDEKPLNDRVLFWSGTRELTHAYSNLYERFTTLEDTLAGFLMNGVRWCGSKKQPGIDFKACPYECSKQKYFWGQAAAKLAKRARGVVHVMLNGTRQHFVDRQIFPSFMDDSYLAENQLSSLPVHEVKEFRILVSHSLHHKSLERCDSLTVLELQNRAKARGLKATCFDNPYFIRHLLCLDNPGDSLCLFKVTDQDALL
ncbi:hypothetical protein OS493_014839 [Desmophyllum pertusum]|uniref:ADP-ribosyl cyclase/cyclic ADP-ribose hydrolase n=1 Tax=Desmophyllum pertusum TaxID=174260 RepID=A0A9W9YGR1_9CNID|nr:hypothetical protein OS493_014839 [Desmophyllum pertusum]